MEDTSESSEETNSILEQDPVVRDDGLAANAAFTCFNQMVNVELRTSPARENVALTETFNISETYIMDDGDRILHEISGISALQDTISSTQDLLPLPDTRSSTQVLLPLQDTGASIQDVLSVERVILQSIDDDQVTLLEDIGDSVLNYSSQTDPSEDEAAKACKKSNKPRASIQDVLPVERAILQGTDDDQVTFMEDIGDSVLNYSSQTDPSEDEAAKVCKESNKPKVLQLLDYKQTPVRESVGWDSLPDNGVHPLDANNDFCVMDNLFSAQEYAVDVIDTSSTVEHCTFTTVDYCTDTSSTMSQNIGVQEVCEIIVPFPASESSQNDERKRVNISLAACISSSIETAKENYEKSGEDQDVKGSSSANERKKLREHVDEDDRETAEGNKDRQATEEDIDEQTAGENKDEQATEQYIDEQAARENIDEQDTDEQAAGENIDEQDTDEQAAGKNIDEQDTDEQAAGENMDEQATHEKEISPLQKRQPSDPCHSPKLSYSYRRKSVISEDEVCSSQVFKVICDGAHTSRPVEDERASSVRIQSSFEVRSPRKIHGNFQIRSPHRQKITMTFEAGCSGSSQNVHIQDDTVIIEGDEKPTENPRDDEADSSEKSSEDYRGPSSMQTERQSSFQEPTLGTPDQWQFGDSFGPGMCRDVYCEQPLKLPTDEQPLKLPADEQLLKLPTDEQPSKLPTDEQPSKLPTEEQLSKLPADEQPLKLPADEQPLKLPADEQPLKLPADEQPSKLPTDEQPSKLPTDEQPSKLPTDDQSSKLPTDEQPLKLPTEEQPSKLPTNEQHVKLPTDEQHVKLPTDEQNVKLPTDEQHVKLPVDDTNIGQAYHVQSSSLLVSSPLITPVGKHTISIPTDSARNFLKPKDESDISLIAESVGEDTDHLQTTSDNVTLNVSTIKLLQSEGKEPGVVSKVPLLINSGRKNSGRKTLKVPDMKIPSVRPKKKQSSKLPVPEKKTPFRVSQKQMSKRSCKRSRSTKPSGLLQGEVKDLMDELGWRHPVTPRESNAIWDPVMQGESSNSEIEFIVDIQKCVNATLKKSPPDVNNEGYIVAPDREGTLTTSDKKLSKTFDEESCTKLDCIQGKTQLLQGEDLSPEATDMKCSVTSPDEKSTKKSERELPETYKAESPKRSSKKQPSKITDIRRSILTLKKSDYELPEKYKAVSLKRSNEKQPSKIPDIKRSMLSPKMLDNKLPGTYDYESPKRSSKKPPSKITDRERFLSSPKKSEHELPETFKTESPKRSNKKQPSKIPDMRRSILTPKKSDFELPEPYDEEARKTSSKKQSSKITDKERRSLMESPDLESDDPGFCDDGIVSPRKEDYKVITEIELDTFCEEIYSGIGEGALDVRDIHDRRRERHQSCRSNESVREKPNPEDSLEVFFYELDEKSEGLVAAGVLADELVRSSGHAEARWISSLREALCKDGTDRLLDMPSFRYILAVWEDELNILETSNGDSPAPKDRLSFHRVPSPPSTTPSEKKPLFRVPTPFHRQPSSPPPRRLLSSPPLTSTSPALEHQSFGICDGFDEADDLNEFGPRRQLVYEETTQSLQGRFFFPSDRRSTLLPRARGSRGVGRGDDVKLGGERLDMSQPPSPITPAAVTSYYHKTMTTALHRDESRETQQSSCSNFLFGEATTSFRDPDPQELQEDLRELQRTKRRLLEKNAELNSQIQLVDDDNTSLRRQCQNLEDGLKNVQHQLKEKDRFQDEIKELQAILENEREEKEAAQARICTVENEKNFLNATLENLQIELKHCQEEVEHLTVHEAKLEKESEANANSFATMIERYEVKLANETKAAESMKKENEDLRNDIKYLEEEIFHTREKLTLITSVCVPETNNAVEEDDVQVNGRNKVPKVPWSPAVILSPFGNNLTDRSGQDTPQSIHSEIHMMGDNDGSLPFCEKSEESVLSTSFSPDNLNTPSGKGDASSLSLLTNILNRWRGREGQNAPLGKEFDDEKGSALYSHFLKHQDELLKFEKELQNIMKKNNVGQSPASFRNASRKSSPPSRRASRNSSTGTRSPEASSEMPDSPSGVHTPANGSRTPGPLVSNLISKFEHSSPSPTPSVSETKWGNFVKESESDGESGSSESKGNKPVQGYNYLKDSKILNRGKLLRQEYVDDRLDSNRNLIPGRQDDGEEPDDTSECLTSSLPHSCNASDVLDSGFEQDNGYPVVIGGTQPLHSGEGNYHGGENQAERPRVDLEDRVTLLSGGLDREDSDSQVSDGRMSTPLRRKLVLKCNTPNSTGSSQLEIDVDLDSDVYMESSQLMVLMKKVTEHEARLKTVTKQLTEAEGENDVNAVKLVKIYRLIIVVSRDIFRWTETVRKEWLSAVPVGREDEGATAPLRTPDPLDDLPLTATHSREEIESLIHTRCDFRCQVSHDDIVKEYVNPESLAIELERELLALKLHVARSHALLHHYQSSSLHGSRSEVSTPPFAATTHVQGVEAGVEADLCGPTCIPRPCDSTATQTPASPISASPECEASVGEEGSVTLSNDGAGDEPPQDDHRPLTPQHRPLYQRMSVSEEDIEEESACVEDMAVSSDHALYAPKPTYDQLDQYSVRPKRYDEKHRRTGLSSIKPHIGGGGGRGGSSDSEEDTKETQPICPSPRRTRIVINRHPRCHSATEESPQRNSQAWGSVFPNLQDSHLRAFGVSVHDPPPNNENLSAQEIENKFKQLSLAFKTDRLTLRQRLDVQQRQRDIAEANFERELDLLRSSILALHEDCIDMELVDAVLQVRKHIDVLTNSSSSLLSASEVWGAVQQEWRVSRALEVLLLHVENVNRLYEHDHQELEEMRKLLTEHQIELPVPPGTASSNQSSVADAAAASRRIRALSLAGLGKQTSSETGNRRISLGPGASKTVLNNFLGARGSRRRASLMPDLRPFHQELAAVAAAAMAKNNSSQDKNEEKTHSNNGMLGSSITEEGSESGDDMGDNNRQSGGEDSPTATSLRRLTHFPLYGQQDPDQRSYEDRNTSQMHGLATDSHLLNNPAANLGTQPQNWMMHGIEELIDLLRERQWPYTSLQTLRGAFTSFLLMLAVFYLILATSSASDDLSEPCPPAWSITVRRHGLPPI